MSGAALDQLDIKIGRGSIVLGIEFVISEFDWFCLVADKWLVMGGWV